MTSGDLIELSAVVEPWLYGGAAAGLVVLVADRLLTHRPLARAPGLDAPMSLRAERCTIALVFAVAAVVRLVGWDSDLTPPFWFAQASTLYIDRILRADGFGATWLRLIATTQVTGTHDSPLLLPIHAGLQMLLGPRFGVPVLCGAILSLPAILLAWALGRRVRSPFFGLVFAAFVACSPLMLTWSRSSALCIGGVTQVLLAMLVGWEAGRRGSVLLAALTGLVMWTSVYHYYAARVAIPLGMVAIVAGAQRSWIVRRGLVLALVAGLAFVAVGRWAHGPGPARDLWPSYGGYVGNRGERTLWEFVEGNVESFAAEARHTLERCVAFRRTGWDTPGTLPGMRNGGLWIVPFAALGFVGLFVVLRDVRRQWLWLVLLASGLALPVVSVTTARRLLVFDLAWCALAAHGLLAIVDVLGVRMRLVARRRVVAATVVAIAVWSITAVFALDASVSRVGVQHIPFGEAGFGDGITCRRCIEAAREWRRDIATGAFVVLFDSDPYRENRTSPGGLVTYGKIAALDAGAPGRFVEGYSLMGGVDPEPPNPGRTFAFGMDFVSYLTATIDSTGPNRIVWQFERPTAWERWLAARLVAAGGHPELFETPLSRSLGLRVVTPASKRADAFAVLREIAPAADSPCIALTERGAFSLGSKVLVLAPDRPGIVDPPTWLAASYTVHRLGETSFTAPPPVAAAVVSTLRGARVELVAESGQHQVQELPDGKPVALAPFARTPIGLNCAAWVGGAWWTLDPSTGRVWSTHPGASTVPPGAWIGIAGTLDGALVLASGDQTVVVYDPVRRAEVARFPARVGPAVRDRADECTPLAVGAGWIATVDLRTFVLSAYDATGRPFGTRHLDRAVRFAEPLGTVAGAGRFLGVGAGPMVYTFELRIDPGCATPLQ